LYEETKEGAKAKHLEEKMASPKKLHILGCVL
jgi:hypothetical protein